MKQGELGLRKNLPAYQRSLGRILPRSVQTSKKGKKGDVDQFLITWSPLLSLTVSVSQTVDSYSDLGNGGTLHGQL